MDNVLNLMKREVPILILILFLCGSGSCFETRYSGIAEDHAILKSSNLARGIPGTGTIDDTDQYEPETICQVSHQDLYTGNALPEFCGSPNYYSIFHTRPNLLLIDRPPPQASADRA